MQPDLRQAHQLYDDPRPLGERHRTPPARIGLGTSTVYPESTASAFEVAASLGYDGVELMIGIDPPSTDINYLRKLQDYHQVAVLSVHSPCLVITQHIWGDGWEKLRRSCAAAIELGADVVVVHPPFRWQRSYARNFVAGIRELAVETGVTIAVENMYPWRGAGAIFYGYLPYWDPTDEDYDALTLDLSHAATSGVRALDYLDAWGERLRHVHLTDGLGSARDEHLFPGQGNQDAWQLVAELGRRGYQGHIIHEINTRGAASRDEREELLSDCLAKTRVHYEAGLAQPGLAPARVRVGPDE